MLSFCRFYRFPLGVIGFQNDKPLIIFKYLKSPNFLFLFERFSALHYNFRQNPICDIL